MYEFFSETVMYGAIVVVVSVWAYMTINKLRTLLQSPPDSTSATRNLQIVVETVVATVVIVLLFATVGLIVRLLSRLLGYQLPTI